RARHRRDAGGGAVLAATGRGRHRRTGQRAGPPPADRRAFGHRLPPAAGARLMPRLHRSLRAFPQLSLFLAGLLVAAPFGAAPAAAIEVQRVVSPGGIEAWLV